MFDVQPNEQWCYCDCNEHKIAQQQNMLVRPTKLLHLGDVEGWNDVEISFDAYQLEKPTG